MEPLPLINAINATSSGESDPTHSHLKFHSSESAEVELHIQICWSGTSVLWKNKRQNFILSALS